MMEIGVLEREALSLDVKTRGRLVARLLESLGICDDMEQLYEGKLDPKLLEELERRSREWDEDPTIGRPADEALAEIRGRFGI